MDEVYKHWLGIHYTAGVKWMAQQAAGGSGAYWLIDAIASYQHEKKVKAEEFQVWTLTVRDSKTATLVMTDGNTDKAIVTQEIPFTDYDEPTCELYLVRTPGQPPILMQPCEY